MTIWRTVIAALVFCLLAIGLAASFLPLIETNTWWIRYLDFPRLQVAVALLVLLVAFSAIRGRVGKLGWTLALPVFLAVGYHADKLAAYSGASTPTAASVEDCPEDATLSVMVANVQMRNEDAAPFLRLVGEIDPDVLLVMETDPWWDRELATLGETFPEKVQHIPEGHGAYGMHLLSKLPLAAPEFLFFFDAYTPTVVTGIELPDGETVRFTGVHPHPPLAWSQPTTLRDGHLLEVALDARRSEAAAVVAGDFNAVPWETVTRRSARIAGLLDPRIGRGFYPTFRAGNPLISWPLDQILYQDGFGLMEFQVLPAFGSDHLPVLARLCHAAGNSLAQAVPQLRPDDLEEARSSIEAARALTPEGSG